MLCGKAGLLPEFALGRLIRPFPWIDLARRELQKRSLSGMPVLANHNHPALVIDGDHRHRIWVFDQFNPGHGAIIKRHCLDTDGDE